MRAVTFTVANEQTFDAVIDLFYREADVVLHARAVRAPPQKCETAAAPS